MLKKILVKRVLVLFTALISVLSLVSCGSAPLKDGVYKKTSTTDEHGYIEVVITVKEGNIAECTMKMFNPDGSEKGEDYGKNDGNPRLFELAQKAMKEASKLPGLLLEKGDIDEVDALSGATKTYNQFKAVVTEMIEEARQK